MMAEFPVDFQYPPDDLLPTMEELDKCYSDMSSLYRDLQQLQNQIVTSGNEDNAIFILNQAEHVREQWQAEESKKISLKAKLAVRQADRDKLREENKNLQAMFTESKAQIASMMYRQDAVMEQLKSYSEVLELIRDMAGTSSNETIGVLPPDRMAHAVKLYADFEKNVGFLQRQSLSQERLSIEISYDTTDDNQLHQIAGLNPARDLNGNSINGNSFKMVIFCLIHG